MKTLASTTNARPSRSPGLLARILGFLLDLDDVTPEEARRRMRGRPSFLARLSPEQLELIRTYDGPENLGPPLTKRERRDLERRMAARFD